MIFNFLFIISLPDNFASIFLADLVSKLYAVNVGCLFIHQETKCVQRGALIHLVRCKQARQVAIHKMTKTVIEANKSMILCLNWYLTMIRILMMKKIIMSYSIQIGFLILLKVFNLINQFCLQFHQFSTDIALTITEIAPTIEDFYQNSRGYSPRVVVLKVQIRKLYAMLEIFPVFFLLYITH